MSIVTYVNNNTKSQLNMCQYCNKNYSSKSNLKAHLQRTKKCIDNRLDININEHINNENDDINIMDINLQLKSLIESNNKLTNIINDMSDQIKHSIDKCKIIKI